MLTRNKTEPLLKCRILHATPGRVRIGCRALAYLTEHKNEIAESITEVVGVSEVTVSNITANLVAVYDTQVIEQAHLVEAVENHLATYSFHAHRAEMEEKNALAVAERDVTTDSIPFMIKEISGTAAMSIWMGAPTVTSPVSVTPPACRFGSPWSGWRWR